MQAHQPRFLGRSRPPVPSVRAQAVTADHTGRVRGDSRRVHRYISDLQYWQQWYPGMQQVQKLGIGDSPVQRGTKFEVQQKQWMLQLPMTYEVVEYEAGKKLVLSGISPYHTCMDSFILMADRTDPNMTFVRYISDVRLREWRSALQPAVGSLLAKVPEKAMQGLQQTLNSPASPIYSPAFEELLRREARAPRSAYGGRSTSSTRSNRSGNQGGGSMWSSLFGGRKGASTSSNGASSSSSRSGSSSPLSSYDTAASPASTDPMGFYKTLGLPVGSDTAAITQEEVKAAYRRLAFTLHPDRHLDSDERTRKAAAERFAALMRAYEALKDPEMRALYDRGAYVEASMKL